MDNNLLAMLPPKLNFESIEILKQLAKTNRALAELKGYSETIPNKNILINAMTINEAKDSSEIENIVSTHDEIYKAMVADYNDYAAKEVVNYRSAIWAGYNMIKENGLLTTRMIIEIQGFIEGSKTGIRKIPGTVLKNDLTNQVVYTPPVGEKVILDYMSNLERYINDDEFHDIDCLIKLAIIHYQFEAIHPFYDGNGRTGRIINILYLVLKGLLDSPILYLSKYIINNRSSYYNLLQMVNTHNKWEEYIVYILLGIEETSKDTLQIIKHINDLMEEMTNNIKIKLPKMYSKDLINLLFIEFYTKIDYIKDGLNITRKTSSNYLNVLEHEGFLISEIIGREKIFINKKLYELIKKPQ